MNPIIDFNAETAYNGEIYMQEFTEFMEKYRIAEISAEEVGLALARLVQYYAAYNLRVTKAERALSIIAQDIESRVDDNGKAISSAKAKVFIEATPEAEIVGILKAHRDNVDKFVSSLRSLQKGVLNEYSAMANT